MCGYSIQRIGMGIPLFVLGKFYDGILASAGGIVIGFSVNAVYRERETPGAVLEVSKELTGHSIGLETGTQGAGELWDGARLRLTKIETQSAPNRRAGTIETGAGTNLQTLEVVGLDIRSDGVHAIGTGAK